MKKALLYAAAALAAALLCMGCASRGPRMVDPNYAAQLAAPRAVETLWIRAATNTSISINGIGEMRISQPVTPPPLPAPEPSWIEQTIGALSPLAPWAALGWIGAESIHHVGKTTPAQVIQVPAESAPVPEAPTRPLNPFGLPRLLP
jgi:hypothetical protein